MIYDVVVIGGGIIGVSVAQRAASLGKKVVLLEKESALAEHQTGRNSGVIHAGPYYKPGSLKASMCTAGNKSMYRFAEDFGIPFKATGKLIVAVEQKELKGLQVLYERALANGVPVQLLNSSETIEIEPHVSAIASMRVRSTGIIDYSAVVEELARQAEELGAVIQLNSKVISIISMAGSVVVEHTRGNVEGKLLVNCAGLHSDKIAKIAGITSTARIIPFRGEYFELRPEQEFLVNGLIYPVPDPELPFLGVHLTKMINGGVHAGPNAVTALAREGYNWRTIKPSEAIGDLLYPGFLRMASRNLKTGFLETQRSFSKKIFAESLARLVPEVKKEHLLPTKAGVRAQAILKNGNLVDDFLIERTENQIHVLNAPSPAATSALEIAKSISSQIGWE